jgi:nucleotide-binding universal stress UspA family protein
VYKHIIVAYDGSEPADRALDESIRFAKQAGSSIAILYVLAPHHLMVGGGRLVPGLAQWEREHAEELRRHARQMLDRALDRVRACGIECEAVLEEGLEPDRHIVEGAKRMKCDLIAMGSHGRGSFESLVAGSQTLKVLARASIPVLVVR